MHNTAKERINKKEIERNIFYQNFSTHMLQKNGDFNVQHINLSNSMTVLFTKTTPTEIFAKMVHKIGMRKFKYLN